MKENEKDLFEKGEELTLEFIELMLANKEILPPSKIEQLEKMKDEHTNYLNKRRAIPKDRRL